MKPDKNTQEPGYIIYMCIVKYYEQHITEEMYEYDNNSFECGGNSWVISTVI